MAKRKKALPPPSVQVEAIWWRDPYSKQREMFDPSLTYAYMTVGFVFRETKRYVFIATEVPAQHEDYLADHFDFTKIYKGLIYSRVVLGAVQPYNPVDDEEDEDAESDAGRSGGGSASAAPAETGV